MNQIIFLTVGEERKNVIKCIGELAHIVQRFTSTAPTKEVEEFMKIKEKLLKCLKQKTPPVGCCFS